MNDQQNDWLSYFDELGETQMLFRLEAQVYVRQLRRAISLHRDLCVLDFGCGHGFIAAALAPLVGELHLWDAAPQMLQRAQRRLGNQDHVKVMDWSAPPEGGKRFDLILVNSVVQYMNQAELASWLGRWRERLAPHGQIILSDLIPPGHRRLGDLGAFLALSVRHRCLLRALRSLWQEKNRYQRVCQAFPLLRMSPDELCLLAESRGLGVQILPSNLTHFPRRFTASLTWQSAKVSRTRPAANPCPGSLSS